MPLRCKDGLVKRHGNGEKNMREILFKAKRTDNGEWMEGVPVDVTPLTCFSSDAVKKEVLMVRAGFADWGMPRGLEGANVDPSTVCQYTGLTDKNGKKIFEGDIILHDTMPFLNGAPFHEGKVVFNEEVARFEVKSDEFEATSFYICKREKDDYEVIGNVHDTKCT